MPDSEPEEGARTVIQTEEDARRANISELIKDGGEIAERHIRLRRETERLIVAVLANMGYKYSGTGGWHILAHATPGRRLGFVNITHGLAVETDVELSPDVIEALTIPDQESGPIASGVAFYGAIDAGEPQNATSPDGWVQLLADVRTHGREPEEYPGFVRAKVVAWCLMTCYKRPGEPGYEMLDGRFHDYAVRPREWPKNGGTEEMRRLAREGFRDVLLKLADRAGLTGNERVTQVIREFDTDGLREIRPVLWAEQERSTSGYSASAIADSIGFFHSEIVRHAMEPPGREEPRVSVLYAVSALDDAWWRGAFDALVALALRQVMGPITATLAAHFGPIDSEHHRNWSRATKMAGEIGTVIMAEIMDEVDDVASPALREAIAAYSAAGPASVSISTRQPT